MLAAFKQEKLPQTIYLHYTDFELFPETAV